MTPLSTKVRNISPVLLLSLLALCLVFGWSGAASAQPMPHPCLWTLTYPDGSIPPNRCIIFEAYITSRPIEVINSGTPGTGYVTGSLFIDVGNFLTPWSPGEVLQVTYTDTCSGISGTLLGGLTTDLIQNFGEFVVSATNDLEITFPNGGETFTQGTSQVVRWRTFGTVLYVNLDYSINGGVDWSPIAIGAINQGLRSWNVPMVSSSDCWVRVRQNPDGAFADMNDAAFRISPLVIPRTLALTSPLGGEHYQAGSIYNVTWTSTGPVANVRIKYSTDDGGSWTVLASNWANSGTFAWLVPNTPSTNCLLSITDIADPTATDTSGLFEIFFIPRTLTLIEPVGGESYLASSNQTVRWTSSGAISWCLIQLSLNNGSNWTTISSFAPNTGSFTWNTGVTPSAQCLVRIRDVDSTYVGDTSPSTFTIYEQPHVLTLNTPSGGEVYTEGTTQTVTWTSEGAIANVMVELSIDGMADWSTLTPSTANTGSFEWTVPSTPSINCYVRISEVGTPGIFDISVDEFIIQGIPATITVMHSNGGEVISEGTMDSVTWTYTGAVGDVDVFYSITDVTGPWEPIGTFPVADRRCAWAVPGTPSTTCRILVRDHFFPAVFDTSDANFEIQAVPRTITILYPNGGEIFHPGDAVPIAWNWTGIVPTITVEWSSNNGSTWIPVAGPITNIGTYAWVAPVTITNLALVRITSGTHPGVFDRSDAVFHIVPFTVPTLTVTVPNGGEVYFPGDPINIAWTTVGSIPFVTVEWSTDGGSSWSTVADGITNIDSYPWVAPAVLTEIALVRVYDASDAGTIDQSNTFFHIRNPLRGLTVTAPNGGEVFTVLSTTLITWNMIGTMPGVKIELNLSYPSGAWTTVIASAAPVGSYLWTVPSANTIHARIRISDATDPAINDMSNSDFTITPLPLLSIWNPHGGEHYMGGNTVDIGWTTLPAGTVPTVEVAYTTDGLAWTTVYTGPNTGEYAWTVPFTPTNNGRVRVRSATNYLIYDLSELFYIDDRPMITLFRPNGGERYAVGGTYAIFWGWTGAFSNVSLDYSTNNGRNWFSIIARTPNVGIFRWTVPPTPSESCLVRVTSSDDPLVTDRADRIFTIFGSGPIVRDSVLVTYPNGGEHFWADSNITITYQATTNVDSVALYFTTDAGINWSMLWHGVPTGARTWTAPHVNSNQCRIKIINWPDGTLTDESNGEFSIEIYVPPVENQLRILWPNGGESLRVGTTVAMQWVTTGTIPAVDLQYYHDGSVTPIASNLTNIDTYGWTIPNIQTLSGQVKITMHGNPAVFDVSDGLFTVWDSIAIPDTGDTIPPDPTTLVLGYATGTLARITWFATGDDHMIGFADHYDMRYSTRPIDEANFNATLPAFGLPTPGAPGSPQTYFLIGLLPETDYYVAIKIFDEAGNGSLMSNVLFFHTLPIDRIPPAAILDLTAVGTGAHSAHLDWSSVGDDGMIGYLVGYDIRYSTGAITEADWYSLPSAPQSIVPREPGMHESLEVLGLAAGTHYYFAVRGVDDGGNEGPLSNIAEATTIGPLNRIPDLLVNEDSPDRTLPNLNTVYFPNSGWTFDASWITPGMGIDIVWNATHDQITLHFQPNWNGVGFLLIEGLYGDVVVPDTIRVTVVPVEDPPVITSTLVDTIAVEGLTWVYDVDAMDPDGDHLTYSLFGAPSGAVINAETGLATWTPTEESPLSVIFEVHVTDGHFPDVIQMLHVRVYKYGNDYFVPRNLVAHDNYDSSVPVEWDAPLPYANPSGHIIPTGLQLATYILYRSNRLSGEYVEIARTPATSYNDITVTNDVTYFYKVTALYQDPAFESGASNVDDGTPRRPPSRIFSTYLPIDGVTLDGVIGNDEWTGSTVVTFTGAAGNTVWRFMNTNNRLYVSVSDEGNLLGNLDYISLTFDNDKSQTWPGDPASHEGTYWFKYLSSGTRALFRNIWGSYPDDIRTGPVSDASEVNYGFGAPGFPLVVEMAWNIGPGSFVGFGPGDSLGMRLETWDGGDSLRTSLWPNGSIWSEPASFGTLVLGSGEGIPVLNINPMYLTQLQPTDVLRTRTLTISNTGNGPLHYRIREVYRGTHAGMLRPGLEPEEASETMDAVNIALYAADDPAVPTNSVVEAMSALGYAYTRFDTPEALAAALSADPSSWTLAVVSDLRGTGLSVLLDALHNYLLTGGRVAISTPNVDDTPSASFWGDMGVTLVRDVGPLPLAVYWGDPGFELFVYPTRVADFLSPASLLPDHGDFLSASGTTFSPGHFVAGAYPGPGAIFVDARRAILDNFVMDENSVDLDGDGMLDNVALWINQITYLLGDLADVPWISVTPPTGGVVTSGSFGAIVTFDSRGLPENRQYFADLIVYHNDPLQDPITIPCTLKVISSVPIFSFNVNPPRETFGVPGSLVEIPLTLRNLPPTAIHSVRLDVVADQTLIQPFDAIRSIGSALPDDWNVYTLATTPDRITIQASGTTPIALEGTLFNVRYIVLTSRPVGSSCLVRVENIIANDGEIGAPTGIGGDGIFVAGRRSDIQWNFAMRFFDATALRATLTCGMAPEATNGWDPGLDAVAPPSLGGLYAVFPSTMWETGLRTDIRANTDTFSVWYAVTTGDRGVVVWTPDSLPRGEVLLNGSINMKLTDSYTFALGETLIISWRRYSEDVVLMNLYPGWNLLSIPVDVPNSRIGDIFPHSLQDFGWIWSNRDREYQQVDSVAFGYGFWVLNGQREVIQLTGAAEYFMHYGLEGTWNLLGSVYDTVYESSFEAQPDTGIVENSLYNYNAITRAYVRTDRVTPGLGHWLLALLPTRLLVSAAIPKADPIYEQSADWSLDLTVDAGSACQYLKVGEAMNASVDLDRAFDRPMPPPGPEAPALGIVSENPHTALMATDIRAWGDAEWTLCSADESYRLNWSSTSIPPSVEVTVEVAGVTYNAANAGEIMVPAGVRPKVTARLIEFGDLSLSPAWPNPFSAQTSFRAAGNVTVHDLSGAVIRTLTVDDPSVAVTWDGRADDGRPVADGTYIIRLAGDERSVSRKVVKSGK